MPDTPRPVMLVILDGWGWREETADNAVRLAQHAEFRPALADLPARVPAHLRPRCRLAGGADGQFRSRPHEYRRRPRRHAGPAAHRQGGRRRHARAMPGVAGLHRQAEGLRRHLPSDGPRLPGRRALAPGPRGRPGPGARAGRRSDRWCMPSPTAATRRRARRGEDLAPLAARRCRRASGSPPSSAATTRWTATSGGTAWPRRISRWPRPRARPSPTPPACVDAAYGGGVTDEFVDARRGRRLSRHEGRRRRCCASTSAPTGCARSWPRCSTRPSTASRGRARSASPPPPA